MKKDDKASISLKKVISVSIILFLLMGISVMAVSSKVKNVKIILSDGYEMNVLTTKENVSEILDDNHIKLLSDEKVIPSLENNISDNKTIRITKDNELTTKTTEVIQTSNSVTAEQLLAENYNNIVEKIVIEQAKIPFETETKDLSTGTAAKKEVVKQKGIDGVSQTTYKVKYQNDIEISRTEVETVVTKQPVKKIVEIKNIETASRGTVDRATAEKAESIAQTASASGNALAAKAKGRTPQVKTLNASAYTASTCDKSPSSPSYGITASGARASAWCTVAAGKGYPMGTIIYIPYFANKANGGWFVVQDRGGAISNSKLDVYMGSHNSALQYGRKTLEAYVYEF